MYFILLRFSFVHAVLVGTVPTCLHYKRNVVRAFTVQRIRFYDIIIIIIIDGGVNRAAASRHNTIITSRHERDNFELMYRHRLVLQGDFSNTSAPVYEYNVPTR